MRFAPRRTNRQTVQTCRDRLRIVYVSRGSWHRDHSNFQSLSCNKPFLLTFYIYIDTRLNFTFLYNNDRVYNPGRSSCESSTTSTRTRRRIQHSSNPANQRTYNLFTGSRRTSAIAIKAQIRCINRCSRQSNTGVLGGRLDTL